ncbi:MAG: type I restriction endonuclease subunit R [Flavobacteriales bacterium]|nr:type I restriction endonuclease subunit R [Flavobacteriales bacterium]
MITPSFLEDHISQIPALQLLVKLGYTYLSPEEAMAQRQGKAGNVLLENILEDRLKAINRIQHKGQSYHFSPANIYQAIRGLREMPLVEGVLNTNKEVYELLTLGRSFEETIMGDTRSFPLRFIDWSNPANNHFHVTEEFPVERKGSTKTRRPDVVLFVNGIPLVVIECKRPDLHSTEYGTPVQQAISQHLRNQKPEEVPQLYIHAQLLLSLAQNDARYATVGTPPPFWSQWKEGFDSAQPDDTAALHALKNTPLATEKKNALFADRFRYVRAFFDQQEQAVMQVHEQDQLLYRLCRPERLLEFVQRYVLFDAGEKKVARYQQYFAVKGTLERVKHLQEGRRTGGVIWHTQGSGKSLTMVLLAKAIAMEPSIRNARIVLVTDRIDLDDQLYGTFKSCEAEAVQARSGTHLAELLHEPKARIITTLMQKFEAVSKRGQVVDESPDIFVLVDESHRSQYGAGNARMLKVLPNACFLGFTGTPLLGKEKNTARKFGGIIRPAYTIAQAVEDGAVVPLLYEGRHVVQEVDDKTIDTFFDLVSEPLNKYQRADLKKKFSRADQLNAAEQKIWRTAFDVSRHWKENWRGSGFKAQLTAPSKVAALKYKAYLDEIGMVSSEVVMSPPDTREGHDSAYEETNDKVQQFWKGMMAQYGNEANYQKNIIQRFKSEGDPELLIVVDKLLTGFDAPRNTVLYLCRSLTAHTLLQAIARVNRLFEGKDFGYIIDYYGVLGELDQALTAYSELSGFDEEDLAGTITHVKEEVEKLAERHAQLWDLFKTLPNKQDPEAFQQHLSPQDVRDQFYDRLSLFVRTLKMALSTLDFLKTTPEEKVERYRRDAAFFLRLRVSVKMRYSDAIDYRQYEAQVQKLIDTHIKSNEVLQLTEQVNIFDKQAFAEEVEKVEGAGSRADMIASRTKKTISERMEEDPVLFKKFSKLLEETIEAYRDKRISDLDYLKQATRIMDQVRTGSEGDEPANVKDKEVARAFYRIVQETVKALDMELDGARAGAIAIRLDELVNAHRIVDWTRKSDVQNRMRQAMEDYLYELREDGLELGFDAIDEILDGVMRVATHRYA